MKKWLQIFVMLLCLGPISMVFGATCSSDVNNPIIWGTVDMTGGDVVYWRIRGFSPDGNIMNKPVTIAVSPTPSWIYAGVQIVDYNSYSWANSYDCDGNGSSLSELRAVSRPITFSPPKNVAGQFKVNANVYDGNEYSYGQIVVNVVKPHNKQPKGQSGKEEPAPLMVGPMAHISYQLLVP
jgi:hypothetical protein